MVWVDSHDKKPDLIGQHLRPGMFHQVRKRQRIKSSTLLGMMPHDQDTIGFLLLIT